MHSKVAHDWRPSAPAALLSAALVVACVDRTEVSADTLGLAVRDAGFPCEGAVSASRLGTNTWRVACSHGSTYIASVLESGDICIDPMPLGDVAGQVQEFDENRCAPDVKAR